MPAELLGKFDCPVAPFEIAIRIPAAYDFLVVALVAPGPFGEEAAALARPGEVRDLLLVQPRLPLIVGGGNAAGPDRIEHFGKREVIGKHRRGYLAALLRIGDRLVETLARP